MAKSPSSFLKSLRPSAKPSSTPAADNVSATGNVESVSLPASPYHPALALFASQKQAQASAELLGTSWAPIPFACGYLITDGWHFHDTRGVVKTFCPVPHECLEAIQDIVTQLQKSDLDTRFYPIHITQALRDNPALAKLKQAAFDSICLCTLMRIAHAPYTGDRNDWLTIPAWALRIPKRRS
ncbi:MAG: hypothetical protein HS122_07215 [Opitutaceae bacterium]|nr:hypothetical protein [Opitutaceae bacterium]